MFFILSKTAAFLLLPSNILIVLGLLGVALLATRWRPAGLALVVASLVLLAVLGFLPLGGMLAHKLESRFPPWDPARGAPDGIVVLGGGIASTLSNEYGDPVLTSDGGRITAIAKLARAYPNARIVYSNGDASLFATGQTDSKYLYLLLDSFGIPRERVLLEVEARNTFENAVFSKELVQPKSGERWLLVTSAQHMPRAVGCFRQAGFNVEAYPVAWRTRPRGRATFGGALSDGLHTLDLATHEWIGLIAYRLTGRTGELLPAP
jgi:uncharacterized SAM-binding protein YcdF (DUF218 family)